MSDISKVTLPNNEEYNLKDATARASILNKYEKPSTGIPKTDLASNVQVSLGKADTALQAGALPAGGTDSDVLVKNGATDYAAKWTSTPKLMGSLAYINTGSTADRLYNPGEYLVYNGQLYKVGSTAISQDQTLTPGGNIQSAAVMDTVNSGEISVPFDGFDTALIIRRTGKVVSVRFPGFSNINLAAWSTHQLATIPEGYRPSINFRFAYPRQNAIDTIPVFVTVYSNGNISVENQSGVARDSGVCLATSFTWAIN